MLPVKLPEYLLVFLTHNQVEFYTIGAVYHGCFFLITYFLIIFREPLGADGKRGRMSGKGAAQRDPAQPDRLGVLLPVEN